MAFRRAIIAYPVLFAYAVVQLFAGVAETLSLHRSGRASSAYRVLYWTDEMVLDILLFLTIVTLTYKALSGKPNRAAAARPLKIIVAVVVLLPFAIFYDRALFSNMWFVGAGQVLHFGAAIMNLALWTALIGSKPRDRQLLTVSAGVGMAATGAAVFYGIFPYVSGFLKQAGDVMLSLTQVLAVFICCWAFWNPPKKQAAPPAPKPAAGY
jgi:hypothetical protein